MTDVYKKDHGNEMYPDYDALWHLKTLGVLDADNAPVGWTAETPAKCTRVAVIDTSVDPRHPNLEGVINKELSIDFFSARLGSFPFSEEGEEKPGAPDLNWSTTIADGLPHTAELLADLVDRLSSKPEVNWKGIQPCTSPQFSSHGTNIAGLVGGRPCMADRLLSTGAIVEIPLPYSGVDPMCEIVQISTNFDPEPEGMILAFLYAELVGADVVLLPRNIADPHRIVPEIGEIRLGDVSLADAVRQTSATPEQSEMWAELAALIENVSHQRPVVCAAGNANEEDAIYPANLASEHNGIISVGAVNAKGFRSSYSGGGNITVLAPSNDAEVFDVGEVRLDTENADFDPVGVPERNANHKYSSFDVISTDVPGAAGYSDSPFKKPFVDGAIREFGSYFSRFGGTSASSALVAGFISLGYSTGQLTGSSGIEAKSWLLEKSHPRHDEEGTIGVPCWSGEPVFPDA